MYMFTFRDGQVFVLLVRSGLHTSMVEFIFEVQVSMPWAIIVAFLFEGQVSMPDVHTHSGLCSLGEIVGEQHFPTI